MREDIDAFHRFGQRCLFAYIRTHGAPSDASLAKLIATKNEIVTSMRTSYGGDADACDRNGDTIEFREILFAAFTSNFEPRTPEETEADRERLFGSRKTPPPLTHAERMHQREMAQQSHQPLPIEVSR